MKTSLTEPIFSIQHRVIYGDTDAGGVVYNANYLKYFEIGRTEFMRDKVCSYRDIEGLGVIMPVTESFSRYKSPGFYDDLLTIETSLTELKKFSCRFSYRITRTNSDGQKPSLLVKGYTVHAAVTQNGKLTPIPVSIRELMQDLL